MYPCGVSADISAVFSRLVVCYWTTKWPQQTSVYAEKVSTNLFSVCRPLQWLSCYCHYFFSNFRSSLSFLSASQNMIDIKCPICYLLHSLNIVDLSAQLKVYLVIFITKSWFVIQTVSSPTSWFFTIQSILTKHQFLVIYNLTDFYLLTCWIFNNIQYICLTTVDHLQWLWT